MAFMKRPEERFAAANGDQRKWFATITAAEDYARLRTAKTGYSTEIIDYGTKWPLYVDDWPESAPPPAAVVRIDALGRVWTDVCGVPGQTVLL